MTTTLPAVPSLADLDEIDVSVVLRRLGDLADWVSDHATYEQCEDLRDQTRLFRSWCEIKKTAKEMEEAAWRLELVIVRRIGQLNQTAHLPNKDRGAARWLARQDDETFERLLKGCTYTRSINVFVSQERSHDGFERRRQRLERHLVSDPDPDYVRRQAPDVAREMADAVQTIIDRLSDADGARFTVAQAADAVGKELVGAGWSDDWLSEDGQTALRGVIRDAVMSANTHDGMWHTEADERVWIPSFITYRERMVGWVRSRFGSSSIAALREMLALREQQLDQMTAVVGNLRLLLGALDPGEDAEEDAPLKDLFHDAVRSGRLADHARR